MLFSMYCNLMLQTEHSYYIGWSGVCVVVFCRENTFRL